MSPSARTSAGSLASGALYSITVRPLRRATVALCALSLAACGDDGFDYTGTQGTPVNISFADWTPTISATVTVGGQTYADEALTVDTGAPVSEIDSSSNAGMPTGKLDVSLDAFALHMPGVELVAAPLGAGGLLGANVLSHFALTLDYQNWRGWLSDPFDPAQIPPDVALDPTVEIPMRLSGGGTMWYSDTGKLSVGPTRVLLHAQFEDLAAPVWVVVDTGASSVVLDSDFFFALDAASPTRPHLQGVTVTTVDGDKPSTMSRVWRVTLASPDGEVSAASVDDVPVLTIPGWSIFTSIQGETGVEVHALIGGSALRRFLATVDYRDSRLVLAPYQDLSFIPANEYVGVGFSMNPGAGGQWLVSDVYPGHDAAAQGLVSGDVVEEIAGAPITGLSAAAVADMLGAYALGQEVPVGLGRNSTVEVHNVLVEDLLPSYPPPS